MDGTNDWQPIETAPRDGTEVLLLIHTVKDIPPGRLMPGAMVVGSFRLPRQASMSYKPATWRPNAGSEYDDRQRLVPTHWMPLPEPPK